MATYCKAYYLAKFRKFTGWIEKRENARKEKNDDSTEGDNPRALSDDSILYLHESLIVTDGVFEDQNIIFDKVTPEWQKFTKEVLKFKVPVFESIKTEDEKKNQ